MGDRRLSDGAVRVLLALLDGRGGELTEEAQLARVLHRRRWRIRRALAILRRAGYLTDLGFGYRLRAAPGAVGR